MRTLCVTLGCLLALVSSAEVKDSTVHRAHNFGPGPAALPMEVLEKAQQSLVNFQGTGIGIMEYTNLDRWSGTHPGEAKTPLQEMFLNTEKKLRNSLQIPLTYNVMFLLGGAVGQFSAVPMNFLGGAGACADYVEQGFWSSKAAVEAQKYGDAKIIAKYDGDVAAPWHEWERATRPCAAYLHLIMSETVQGVEILSDPPDNYAGPPIVLDATSTLLSRPINISKYGFIYASGGKNIPQGVTVAIVRKEFLRKTRKLNVTPLVFDYRLNSGCLEPVSSVFESKPNTPPVWSVYVLGEVLDHINQGGGLIAQEARTSNRSSLLYNVIDTSGGFYINIVHKDARSRMNVVFNISPPELEEIFLDEADKIGLNFVWGHPSQKGCRITTYNWVTDEAISAIFQFMIEFSKKYNPNHLDHIEL